MLRKGENVGIPHFLFFSQFFPACQKKVFTFVTLANLPIVSRYFKFESAGNLLSDEESEHSIR